MKSSIDFLITQNCNYRCAYCSQSKKFLKGKLEDADDETIECFLKFLSKLDKKFEITISGGEPLCHKKFFYLAEKIVSLGHKISVVSNFSFPLEQYKKLKEISGENLSELFVSLHLSQIKNLEDFLYKAQEFNKIKNASKFTIGAVLTDDNLEELKKAAEFFKQNNIDFELQHMRIKNEFVKYKNEALEFIQNYPISKIKEKSNTYSKLCAAGKDFLLIYQNGECYRCYSSRFNKIHSLGNIKNQNFKMFDKCLPCLNKKCTCPKPIINGMIDYNSNSFIKASILSLYNILWLPYYAVKNFDILKTKLIQSFNFKK